MELGILAGASLIGYLVNQRQRETNFVEENSVPLDMVADQYKPFNDPQFQNLVGCTGSYPVYNEPSISQGNQGYINYMNQQLSPYAQGLNASQINAQLAQNPTPGLPLNEQPNYIQAYGMNPPNPYSVANNDYLGQPITVGPNNSLRGFEQAQQQKTQDFNHMVAEQNPFYSAKKESFGNVLTDKSPTLGNGNQLLEDHVNFIPANDPTSDFLLDIQTRPNTDFSHNNMVPFFGAKVTQNMAGTGVAQGNYIDGVTVDSGSDQTTPFQGKLSTFTGLDDTYMHKRETGPMFSPAEQQTGWTFGQPQFREDEDRFTQSLTIRNDLVPVEPEMVGPGLDLDPSIPAAGGYHEFTRIMPNNVGAYKSSQLQGRVNMGKWVEGGELPTSYPGIGVESELGKYTNSGPGVVKNRPNTFWDQARRPTMTTKAAGLPNQEYLKADWDSSKKPNNAMRDQTSYGYGDLVPKTNPLTESFANVDTGTLGYPNSYCVDFSPTVGITPSRPISMAGVRDPTFMSQDNNIKSVADCNSQPIGNPGRPGAAPGNMMNNWYVNETDRGSINPTMILQTGVSGGGQPRWNNLSFRDGAKVTMKETNEYSYHGNPKRDEAGTTFYTYDDLPKTTMTEISEFSYHGNPKREEAGVKFYTYDDEPKTTMKETNQYSYHGNPDREGAASTFYTYGDKPKPTIKQSTEFTYAGNPEKEGKAPKFYTYEDKPKPTVKQTTEFSYTGNNVREDQGVTFYTYKDQPKPTIRQTTEFSYAGNVAIGDLAETSRYQFTGPTNKENFANVDFNKLRGPDSPFNVQFQSKLGGADTFTIRGTTLIEDYIPGPGRSNIRQDADYLQGRIDFGTFGTEIQNGPGTLAQALPSSARFQNTRIMATPHAAPNKLFGIDDRQLASYQVEKLKENPLSIFTTNPDGEIPEFGANTAPDDYSSLVMSRDSQTDALLKAQKVPKATNPKGGIGGIEPVNVYPPDANVLNINENNNPNMNIVDNKSLDSTEKFNRLIGQGSSRAVNSDPIFSGKAYSGQFGHVPGTNPDKLGPTNPNDPITIGGPDPGMVYGAIGEIVPRQENDVGMINPTMGNMVCKPNDALDFSTPLIL